MMLQQVPGARAREPSGIRTPDRQVFVRPLALALDVALGLATAAIAAILVTGGGVFVLEGVRVSARSVANPLAIALAALAARFLVAPRRPFLFQSRTPADVLHRIDAAAPRILEWLQTATHADVRAAIVCLIAASAALKLANAYFYFGFISGDDVEVQEMSFAALFGWDLVAWEVRNAFYPLAFLYPVQRALLFAGVTDPAWLIFAGRTVVIAISLVLLWLVYLAGRQLSGRPGVGLLACGLLAASGLHTRFAASELPRTVAATILALAFLISIRKPASRATAGATGALVGLAGSLRFSELLFAGAEIAARLRTKEWTRAALVAAGFTATAAAILATSDRLYWGSPFASLASAFRYTILEGLSTRGFQPWHFYLTNLDDWTTWLAAAASFWSAKHGHWRLFLWTWTPVLALSLLPHKEVRYLVPVLPFLSLGAALGLVDWLERIEGLAAPHRQRALLLLAAAIPSALVLEAGGYRFRRSEDGVRLARTLAQDGVRVLAAEQAWRLGGRLYLPRTRILDLQPSDVRGPRFAAIACDPQVEAVVTWTTPAAEAHALLLDCGFRVAGAIDVRYRSYRRDRPSRAVAAVLADADVRP